MLAGGYVLVAVMKSVAYLPCVDVFFCTDHPEHRIAQMYQKGSGLSGALAIISVTRQLRGDFSTNGNESDRAYIDHLSRLYL